MSSKARGKLSKREYAAKLAGKPMPYAKSSILKPTKSAVMDTQSAKKAASTSVSKESQLLASAQKEYLASLTPDPQETQAIQANQNLLMGQELESKKIQSQAIASPFIERQIGALADKTESASIPLKYQIAALQSQREARGNIAQAKTRFAGEAYNRKVASFGKETDPLDTEYKQLRNANAQATLDKKRKSPSGTQSPSKELSQSNTRYNLRKTDDAQRGFITLPKGVSGPPMPKVLKKKGRDT